MVDGDSGGKNSTIVMSKNGKAARKDTVKWKHGYAWRQLNRLKE